MTSGTVFLSKPESQTCWSSCDQRTAFIKKVEKVVLKDALLKKKQQYEMIGVADATNKHKNVLRTKEYYASILTRVRKEEREIDKRLEFLYDTAQESHCCDCVT